MRKNKRERKVAQEKPGSNGESKRHIWKVKRLGWAKGKEIDDWGSYKVQKKRKSQGANGLVANQSWVMTTLPWARLTDGDHLSALALPCLPLIPDSLCQIISGSVDPPPKNPALHACKQQIYTLSPVRVCLICQFINHVRRLWFLTFGNSNTSVGNWFSGRIDWTKLSLGSIARGGQKELVVSDNLFQASATFCALGALKKGEKK